MVHQCNLEQPEDKDRIERASLGYMVRTCLRNTKPVKWLKWIKCSCCERLMTSLGPQKKRSNLAMVSSDATAA